MAPLYDYADQKMERFAVNQRIDAGTTAAWGGLEWRALAAPGHDMGALVFDNPEHRILIAAMRCGKTALASSCRGRSNPAHCRRRAQRST